MPLARRYPVRSSLAQLFPHTHYVVKWGGSGGGMKVATPAGLTG